MQRYKNPIRWFLLVSLFFLMFPDVDIWVSGLFYSPESGFFWRDAAPMRFVYEGIHFVTRWLSIFLLGSLLVRLIVAWVPRLRSRYAASPVGAASRRIERRVGAAVDASLIFRMGAGALRAVKGVWREVWGFIKGIAHSVSTAKLVYLALCMALGPGLVVNTIFKNEWGRARPHQIVEFGGADQFTPVWVISNQCAKNCSFVSGHAAMGYYLFAFAFLAFPPLRRSLFALSMVAGFAVGMVRVVQGDHFLSDVILPGFFVFAVCAALYELFVSRGWLEDARSPGRY